MRRPGLKLILLLLTAVPVWGMGAIALADPLIPARDGTRTQVTVQGNRQIITGGQRSSDRANLFHSFERFGLSAREIAEFRSAPAIQNILTRVTGGDPSIINGLIRVTGGESNLFLMNPAGVIFGNTARLDLPASFTATTATGIGLGSGWFEAIGTPNYATLVGTPRNFAFATTEPGAIVNAGRLSVEAGESVILLGGTIVNTGSINAPGGNITLTAVPGENRVRLRQTGSLLGIEFQPLPAGVNNPLPFTPLSLPELLTGGDLTPATRLTVDATGTVRLVGADTVIPTQGGTAIVVGNPAANASGTLNVAAQRTARPPQVTILGEQVSLLGATINAASGFQSGVVQIGGAYQGGASLPSAEQTIVDRNSLINADAIGQGNGGRVILWANDFTRFGGSISARGGDRSGNGGFVEVSGRNALVFRGWVDTSAANGQMGTLLLDPVNINIVGTGQVDDRQLNDGSILGNERPNDTLTISTRALFNASQRNSVRLEATNNIRVANGVSLDFSSLVPSGDASITFLADSDRNGQGNFRMDVGESIRTLGRDLTIFGANVVVGAVDTTPFSIGDSGNVTLAATNGSLIVRSVNTEVRDRSLNSGSVFLSATDSVRITGRFVSSVLNRAVSISTAGSNPATNPRITISHGGNEFVIGGTGTNSSAGAIATGTDVLSATTVSGSFTSAGRTISIIGSGSGGSDGGGEGGGGDDGNDGESENEFDDDFENEDSFDDSDEAIDEETETNIEIVDETDTEIDDTDDREDEFTDEFDDYFEFAADEFPTVESPADTLNRILTATGVRPALLYVYFAPTSVASASSGALLRSETDQLQLVLVTGDGQPILRQIRGVTRAEVERQTRQLLNEITDVRKVRTTTYLPPAQQLYRWLIAPIETELQQQGIQNIAFILDAGVRSLPIAALHDGSQFLVERYSLGLMPSLSLTDTRYEDIRNSQVLAMGASQFQDQAPLPAVPIELEAIAEEIWQGEFFLNNTFTPDNLRLQREEQPFGIVHLATHGEFRPGNPANSYIQFWNQRLGLDQIRQLGLNNPPVNLLVLSACRTALGDQQAELGFAGFAVQAGVKSALASLWYVSDEGTLALMTEFYRQLREARIKAEALRRAQIAMLQGTVRLQGNDLIGSRGGGISLPSSLAGRGDRTLTHPYYWAAFTLIGSPW